MAVAAACRAGSRVRNGSKTDIKETFLQPLSCDPYRFMDTQRHEPTATLPIISSYATRHDGWNGGASQSGGLAAQSMSSLFKRAAGIGVVSAKIGKIGPSRAAGIGVVTANIGNIRAQGVRGTSEHECRAEHAGVHGERECRLRALAKCSG